MKHRLTLLLLLGVSLGLGARAQQPFGNGTLTVKHVARNAVRIQYTEGNQQNDLPDWIYVKHDEVKQSDVKVDIDSRSQRLTIRNKAGQPVFVATSHQLRDGVATLAFQSPRDEALFGLGQFQDGYTNVRGLSRRLTQVNTQISLPCSCRARATACCGTTTA